MFTYRSGLFLALAFVLGLIAPPRSAQAQVAVGISGGTFVTAQNCQACTLNMNNATTGTLVVGRGGTGLATFTAAGAIPYSTGATTLAALQAATNGFFLQLVGGLPAWSQTLGVANGGLGLNSATAGGLPYGTGATSYATLAAGTSGYLLQSGGTGAPSWVPPSSVATGAVVLTGQTLPATPVVGQVMYLSGNNTLTRGIATTCLPALVAGAYQGVSGQIQTDGPQLLFFDSGLTLTANDAVYVSDVNAGQVTNVAPTAAGHCVVLVGRLVTNVGYVSLTGSALNVVWQQPSLVQQL